MLTGINHITLATADLTESIAFYKLFGFQTHVRWKSGAYLTLNDLWLCLALGKVDKKSDYSHIAFSIEERAFEKCYSTIRKNNIREWKTNSSEGNSLYILDPSDHKLEIHVGDLESRLNELKETPYEELVWFDNNV